MTISLGILTTHPIQYQVPWFRLLAAEAGVELTVFFCMLPNAEQQGIGFGVSFQWDIPLLDGYRHRVLENVARRPALSTFSGCDTPGIAEVVRSEGFEAFIATGWLAKSSLQLLRACNRRDVPCLVRGESNDLRPRVWWKRLLHRRLLRCYSGFLCIGAGNRRFYVENGVPEEKLFFAPYCVENERLAAASAEWRLRRDESRALWGIPTEAVVYLFCGKFIPKKRPMDTLLALERACAGLAGVTLHLLMVGAGDQLEECRAFSQDRRLPVSFVGFLNQREIARAYATADCLVLPSDDGETWGLVVNEAMACGLPAIVSDRVGCHPDLVTPDETGCVFALGDTEALALLMTELARQPQRLISMGSGARNRVARYNYAAVVRGTLEALDAVCPSLRSGEGVA